MGQLNADRPWREPIACRANRSPVVGDRKKISNGFSSTRVMTFARGLMKLTRNKRHFYRHRIKAVTWLTQGF